MAIDRSQPSHPTCRQALTHLGDLTTCHAAHPAVQVSREDCYQVLEALSHAAETAATIHAFAAQIEMEEAFGLLRDRLLPNLPDAPGTP